MSYRIRWFGVTLFVLGMVIGAQYVRAAVGHHGSTTINASAISPEELTLAAGVLTTTEVDSYF